MKQAVSLALLALLASGCEPGGGGSGSGRMAPDFTLSDVDGNAVTLSTLRGKAVLLDFWFLA